MDITQRTCSKEGDDCPIGRNLSLWARATVNRDSQGVTDIDYLERDETVTGLCCAELLGIFNAEGQKKPAHLAVEIYFSDELNKLEHR